MITAAVIVGLVFIALGIYYWIEPAGDEGRERTGYEAGSGHHHVKHRE